MSESNRTTFISALLIYGLTLFSFIVFFISNNNEENMIKSIDSQTTKYYYTDIKICDRPITDPNANCYTKTIKYNAGNKND